METPLLTKLAVGLLLHLSIFGVSVALMSLGLYIIDRVYPDRFILQGDREEDCDD